MQLYGIDVSHISIELAAQKARIWPGLTASCWVADVSSTGLDDQECTVVVCLDVLLYFPDKLAAIKEIFRILKPGDLFAFTTWEQQGCNLRLGADQVDDYQPLLQQAGFAVRTYMPVEKAREPQGRVFDGILDNKDKLEEDIGQQATSMQRLNYSPPVVDSAGRLHLSPKPERFPVSAYLPLPKGTPPEIPPIQWDFELHPESPQAKDIRESRLNAVKSAFAHSWQGYKMYAWGQDEVGPISGGAHVSFGGWGATMVDSLDALWLMGMQDDFEAAVHQIEKIDFTYAIGDTINVFETTIRYVGGLLAAFEISGSKYPSLLLRAKELGDILYATFDTHNRLPVTRWAWQKSAKGLPLEVPHGTLLAELGSMSLEFTRLTQLTGDKKFFDAVSRVEDFLADHQNDTWIPGLWPTIIDTEDATFTNNHFTFGGMADSTYEYLPKQYLMLGALNRQTRHMYETAIETAKKYFFFRPMVPKDEDILLSGNAYLHNTTTIKLDPQGQHLACFIGGMMGIGSRIYRRPADLRIARKLVDGCIWAYNSTPSGLMSELFRMIPCQVGVDSAETGQCRWNEEIWYEETAALHGTVLQNSSVTMAQLGKQITKQKGLLPGYTDMSDNRYLLRPEAIESIFVLYRITGDTKYQDVAWKMFQVIERAAKTDIAYAAIVDARAASPEKEDRMESFWLAETLKYFYLIFSEPTVLSLDEWVFNTEAHAFKRPVGASPW